MKPIIILYMEKKPDELDEADIFDDDLLNDDLDNDPLLAEAAQILGVPVPKQEKNTQPIAKKQESVSSPGKNKDKPKIDKKTVREFANFLIKKEKVYEEIGFETILRKIPKDWNYDEPLLIDILEILISNNTIKTFSMKMTANSVKFYPLKSKLKKS